MKSLNSILDKWFDAKLLEFFFVGYFYDKIMCHVYPYSSRHFEITLWYKNKWGVDFSSISAIISSNTTNTFLFFAKLKFSKFS